MQDNMLSTEDIAYIAGLFDGEGSIYFARRNENKKKHNGKGYRISMSQRISMEISMTDQSVIRWVHEVLGVGTVVEKRKKGFRKNGTPYLKQWKWRCTFRDAYYVCRLLWPYAHTKLPKINKIIDHYSGILMNGNVVDIEEYKLSMSLE
jgi:ketosteroid isomerase-like protein